METLPPPGCRESGTQLLPGAPADVLGATSEPTGTPEKSEWEEGQGVVGRITDTRQVSFYLSERCLINHHPLQHLLWLPEKKNSSTLDVNNSFHLPPGARTRAWQPRAALTTSFPKQTQPDLY